MKRYIWLVGLALAVGLGAVAAALPNALRTVRVRMTNFMLMSAAGAGDTTGVSDSLKDGADIEARDARGQSTALILAASMGHTEVVRMLLDAGAQVNAQNVFQNTALMLAANKGHLEIVRLLIKRGADAALRNQEGRTAAELARSGGHPDVADLLTRSIHQPRRGD